MSPGPFPNLFIPGAQKSGTSTLHNYLAMHPDIFMSPNKEPHYLTRVDKSAADYQSLFRDAGTAQYRGEASTAYMASPTVVAKIKEMTPEARFIFVLRNPVDRAWSHYCWLKGRYGREQRTFRVAFEQDANSPPPDPMPVDRGYYHNGTYHRWIEMYRETFGAGQIHVTVFEELTASPLSAVNAICRFLELQPLADLEPLHLNKTEVLRLQAIARGYAEAGRIAANILTPILPHFARVIASDAYRKGGRWIGEALAVGTAPEIDSGTRRWAAGFYRESVDSLRGLTGLALPLWDADFPATTRP